MPLKIKSEIEYIRLTPADGLKHREIYREAIAVSIRYRRDVRYAFGGIEYVVRAAAVSARLEKGKA